MGLYKSRSIDSLSRVMFLKWILYMILLNNLCACSKLKGDNVVGRLGITRMREIRQDIKDCVKTSTNTTWSCLKISSLKLFDEMMESKVIPIWRGVRLVRITDYDDDTTNDPRRHDFLSTFDGNGNVSEEKDGNGLMYLDQIAKKIARILQTHALQVSLKNMVEVLYDKGKETEVNGTPRHRRHRNNMMIAMVFGVTALGAVLVPMGFQILSVVSGKALLLAKMALLLASVNGLRKIANSGVHYGLYQVPGDPYHPYGYYDRGDAHANHPRNIQSLIAHPVEEII